MYRAHHSDRDFLFEMWIEVNGRRLESVKNMDKTDLVVLDLQPTEAIPYKVVVKMCDQTLSLLSIPKSHNCIRVSLRIGSRESTHLSYPHERELIISQTDDIDLSFPPRSKVPWAEYIEAEVSMAAYGPPQIPGGTLPALEGNLNKDSSSLKHNESVKSPVSKLVLKCVDVDMRQHTKKQYRKKLIDRLVKRWRMRDMQVVPD